jgi:putative flippase GtrA
MTKLKPTIHQSILSYFIKSRLEIIKFICVGFITFGINLFSFHICYGLLSLNYKIATSIAYIITTGAHFLLNRIFTFRATGQNISHHTFKYLIMLFLNYILTLMIMFVSVKLLTLSPYLALAISTAIIACSNFLVMRHIVFRNRCKLNLGNR